MELRCNLDLCPRTKSDLRRRHSTRRTLHTIAVLTIFISLIFNGVKGQEEKSDESLDKSPCLCGVDRVPCVKNLTSSDCPNGRVIARRDCKCCFVCAKQLTEKCDSIDSPCDEEYGLECGMDKLCKGIVTSLFRNGFLLLLSTFP
jgi:hypothetical protein